MRLMLILMCDIQGVPVSSHSMGSNCECTVLQVNSPVMSRTLWQCWKETSRTNWKCHQPMQYKVMPEPPQKTLLRVFSSTGGRKCYNTFSILMTSVHVTTWFPKLKSICILNNFQTNIIILTAIWCNIEATLTSPDVLFCATLHQIW